MNKLETPLNILQIIKIFLENIEKFYNFSNKRIIEISNNFETEINNLSQKYSKGMDFSTLLDKKLLKSGINKKMIAQKISSSYNMKDRKNDRQILIQSYHKSLELANLLEIYSNLCLNILIKNFSFEDILHAKTNIVMKEIYNKSEREKNLLIT